MLKAIYPGTFDPITNGHLDIIKRAARLFDLLIIAVAASPGKAPMFDLAERVALIRAATAEMDKVTVLSFDTLMADFARQQQASVLVRGVRSGADVEYEHQLARMNQHLLPGLETIFLFSDPRWSFISSSLVKDVFFHGGAIHDLVPAAVAQAMLRQRRDH